MKTLFLLAALIPFALFSQQDMLITIDGRQLIGEFKGTVVDNVTFQIQNGEQNVINYIEIKRLILKDGSIYNRFFMEDGKLSMTGSEAKDLEKNLTLSEDERSPISLLEKAERQREAAGVLFGISLVAVGLGFVLDSDAAAAVGIVGGVSFLISYPLSLSSLKNTQESQRVLLSK